jgi:hypothetical protein
MIVNTDPQQTETKHTTQKTKMTSNTDPHKEKQNTQHRKLKCQATQTPHKQKTSNTDTHPPDLPQTKTKHTTQKIK